MQTILGPPFCWRWNRAELAAFALNGNGTQDYVQAIADFGFLEKAWLQDAGGGDYHEIDVKQSLARTKEKQRPSNVAAQFDDNGGNITFRFLAAPEQAYLATMQYQKKAPLLLTLAASWAPVPDEFSYIYNFGFLAMAAVLRDDPRFPIFNQKFMSHLLGAAEGLDDLQKNIFVGNWMELVRMMERSQLKTQQGIGARGQ